MSKWSINKSFDFAYSHRVFNQVLDPKLSANGKCACRHNHGHNGKVVVYLTGEELNSQGMVVDFRNLQFFKVWLDEVLDHKCILSAHDPALSMGYPILRGINIDYGSDFDRIFEFHKDDRYFTIWKDMYQDLPMHEQEIYEGLVLVDFVPTSENLAKWLFDIVQKKLEGYAVVEKVEFWETPKSCSTYYGS